MRSGENDLYFWLQFTIHPIRPNQEFRNQKFDCLRDRDKSFSSLFHGIEYRDTAVN